MAKQTVEERLQELLDQKDARIEELEQKEQEREEEKDENRWRWSRHYEPDENLLNLPVPRLQMVWRKITDDGYNTEWCYDLVYRHFLGHLIAVPLGHTSSSGGNGEPPIWKQDGGRDNRIKAGDFWLPFRDGSHIHSDAAHMGIPAFAVVEDKVRKLVVGDDGMFDQEEFVPDKKKIPVEIESWCGGRTKP